MIDLDLLRVLFIKNLRLRYLSAIFGYFRAAATRLLSVVTFLEPDLLIIDDLYLRSGAAAPDKDAR